MGNKLDLTDEELSLFKEFLSARQQQLMKQLNTVQSTLKKVQGIVKDTIKLTNVYQNPLFEGTGLTSGANVAIGAGPALLATGGWRGKIDSALSFFGGAATAGDIVRFIIKHYPEYSEKDRKLVMRSVTSRLSTLSDEGHYKKETREGEKTLYSLGK